MVFLQKNDTIYIKRKSLFWVGNIFLIILLLAFIFVYGFFENNEISSKNNWWNINVHDSTIRIFIIIFIIMYIVFLIMNIIYYSNYYCYININEKNIYFINGRWKFTNKITLNFNQVKCIILLQNVCTEGEGGNRYSYKIDIYDIELNAYELFEDTKYETTNKIAIKISEILDADVIDWTHVENYEGYKKRIV
jgi:heme/copper-type cytochrome/quinol oxidase subunit 2